MRSHSNSLRRARPLLGTIVDIRVDDAPRHASAAIDAAFVAVERVQRLMSAHDADSELSRINCKAHLHPVEVDPWTWQVLDQALAIHRATDGMFDCAVGRELAVWGLLPEDLFVAPGDRVAPSLAQLELLDGYRVRTAAPLGLDLGGIAKGFAVDRAIDALRAHGIDSAVVNAGGDLRVIGERAEPVHVRDPRDPMALRYLGDLADGAFATSAPYFSTQEASVANVSALVDPRSRRGLTNPASYSVIASNCLVADALTKALVVGGNPRHPCFAHYASQPIVLEAAA